MPPTPLPPARRAKDNERPLVEDIRLLGRILGDVIREQEGVEAYELVERIRKLSVSFRRHEDQAADRELKALLKSLSGDEAVRVIRAFTYFSHLANLAEDRHHIRRREVHERAGDTQEGSIEVALARLRWAGVGARSVAQTLAHSYVSPVLTAHPTEVQRKSILDAERDIARLLAERDDIKARALPRDDPAAFLRFARLVSLYHLKAGSVVERIESLALGPLQGDSLHVKFRGVRGQKYSNVAPTVIEFEGDCSLPAA